MDLKLIDDASAASGPAGFLASLQTAVGILDSVIKDNITVTVTVGWGEVNGEPLNPIAIAEAAPVTSMEKSYNDLVGNLTRAGTSADDKTFLADLPPDPTGDSPYLISNAQEKTWGILSPTGPEVDGVVGFSSSLAWDFDPSDGTSVGMYDAVGTELHELTHVLGRFALFGGYTPMSLLGYSYNPGDSLDPNSSDLRYLSIDGGKTNLGVNFDTVSDPGDFATGSVIDQFDPFNAFAFAGHTYAWTPLDSQIMDVLGYNVGAPAPPPPPPPIVPPPPIPPPPPPLPPLPPPPLPPLPPPPPVTPPITPPVITPPPTITQPAIPPVITPPAAPPVTSPPTPTPGLSVFDTTTQAVIPAVADPYTGPVQGLTSRVYQCHQRLTQYHRRHPQLVPPLRIGRGRYTS